MKNIFAGSLRKRVIVGSIVLGGIALLFTYLAMDKRINFEEEVGLADGQVIIIERHFRAKPLGEIGGPGGWRPTYASFEIRRPSSANNPPKWESDRGLIPMLFDRDPATGEWFVVATFFMCEAWYDIGRPKLPYAEFRARNGAWQRVDLTPSHIGRKQNVFTGMKYSGEPALLTRAEKAQRDSDTRIVKKYLEIVATWSTSC